MNKIIKIHEYFVAWIVWFLSTMVIYIILRAVIVFTGGLLGIEASVDVRKPGGWIMFIAFFLSSFLGFVLAVIFIIVRKVKERVKQQIHQRYQKLLEEKGIQLEDSDV